MKRAQLREFMCRLGPDSVAIIANGREVTRSNDTQYRYRPNSDFYYVTGFDEPEAIAVIMPSHDEHKYVLFVRPRDPAKETWDGPRAGVEGALKDYGADTAFPIEEFPVRLEKLLAGAQNLYYRIGAGNEDLDRLVMRQIARLRMMARQGIYPPQAVIDLGSILHEMRLVKTDDEIATLERAADIASEAHIEAMKATGPGMKEYEIEALIEYSFRKNGALAPAYGSTVAAGANATVLHYSRNDATLCDGDLLLVDAGAEYSGYASDISRTFPINGRFTLPQREIYDLVLQTQLNCIQMVRPGVTIDELHNRSVELLTEGMVRLGLLSGDPATLIREETYKRFYMHRLGHYLGMDVHDVGLYHTNGESRRIRHGMVMTIEPGVYIKAGAENAAEKYWNIGVRIEDDVLVTENGSRVLTHKVPKQIDEIEEVMNSRRNLWMESESPHHPLQSR